MFSVFLRRRSLTQGIGSLWAGLQPALLMSVPGTVLYFAAYEAARDAIAERRPDMRDSAPLLAGGGARMFSATVVSPIELMRTRMQAEPALLRQGMVGGAAALVRREGYSALWKGLGPTLWRDVPFSCLYWLGYESLKRRLRRDGYGGGAAYGELDPSASFVCGALSGACAAFLTTPFDVLKTRRQVAEWATEAEGAGAAAGPSTAAQAPAGGPSGSAGTYTLLLRIAREEGLSGLFAGLAPRIAKVAPSCAIMIASYELGKGFFMRRRSQELEQQQGHEQTQGGAAH